MERTIITKFFYFRQNNSGGYFIENDDVATNLIIEAQNARDAKHKMYDITENYSEYCSCCGQRWSDWVEDDDGTDEPMIYDDKVSEISSDDYFCSSTIIYYLDGTKEKLFYEN